MIQMDGFGAMPAYQNSAFPLTNYGSEPSPFAFQSTPFGTPAYPVNPEPIDLPDEISQEFIDAAVPYIFRWLKASYDYSLRKQPLWLEDRRLWRGEVGINDLIRPPSDQDRGPVPNMTRQPDKQPGVGEYSARYSDFIYPLNSPIVAFASGIFNSIFSGPEWLVIQCDELPGDQTDRFDVAQRIQKLFSKKLDEGGIRRSTWNSLIQWPVVGHQFGKVFWHKVSYFTRQWDYQNGITEKENIVRSVPVLDALPIERVLMDSQATVSDTARHRGVGHWVLRTYEEILSTFDAGGYNLNRDEFEKHWKHKGSSMADARDEMDADPDTFLQDYPDGKLKVWEWHGSVPFQGRDIESTFTCVTERSTEDPSSGLPIRLKPRPALQCGKRPIVGIPFVSDVSKQLGLSMRVSVWDIHHTLSQLIGMFCDAVAHGINRAVILNATGQVYAQMGESTVVPPGKVFTSQDPQNEVYPFPSGEFHLQELIQLINLFEGLLQKSTHSTDTYQGIAAGGRQTATEIGVLQQQSGQPASTLAQLFVWDYLQPLIDIALNLFQSHMAEDETFTVPGEGGIPQSITVTAEEIRMGKYRAIVTLTNQDATSIAKAQIIERLLPTLMQLQPTVGQDGWRIVIAEWLKRLIDLVHVDGADRLMRRLTPEEQAQRAMQQMQAMQSGMTPGGPDGGNPSGQGQVPQETQPGMNGGPLGSEPTNENIIAQLLQQAGYQMNPNQAA